jgi:uncharacterized cupredoxin-like copper-binding protein
MFREIDRETRLTHIKRIGLYSALAVVMLLALAACGELNTTGPATDNSTGQSAAVTEPTATTAQPEATPTDDMGDMMTAEPTEGVPSTAEPTATPVSLSADSVGSSGSTVIQATLREWAIDLSTQEVAAGKITFVVNNQGQFAHNLTVTNDSGTIGKTSTFRASEGPQTLEVDLQPGTYTIICDLPGHAARGQMTTLVVK